jgi:hypothetical protein
VIRGGLHPPFLPANAAAVSGHFAARQIVASAFPDVENVFV